MAEAVDEFAKVELSDLLHNGAAAIAAVIAPVISLQQRVQHTLQAITATVTSNCNK